MQPLSKSTSCCFACSSHSVVWQPCGTLFKADWSNFVGYTQRGGGGSRLPHLGHIHVTSPPSAPPPPSPSFSCPYTAASVTAQCSRMVRCLRPSSSLQTHKQCLTGESQQHWGCCYVWGYQARSSSDSALPTQDNTRRADMLGTCV